MSVRLQARLAEGAYGALTSPPDFAERLQIDLREVSKDRHVFVTHDPQRAPGLQAAAGAGEPSALSPAEIESSRRHNFGLREVRLLDGNVGYLDLRDFEHPSFSGAKLAAAMALLSDCDAVILDLRNNGGGWPSTTALLASYFFAPGQAVHFTDFYDRVKGETPRSPGAQGASGPCSRRHTPPAR